MRQFSNENIIEFKDFLYNSNHIHDAEIINTIYRNDSIFMLCNNAYAKKLYMIKFENIRTVFLDNSVQYSKNETISSLTIGFDECDISKYIETNDYLQILIEMFSGKQIYIVCKRVFFEDKDADRQDRQETVQNH